MTLKESAMDVYSWRMDIPFNVAAYCRGHKYSPEAVELARAIKAVDFEETAIAAAQKRFDAAVERMDKAKKAVVEKMEREHAV